METYVNDKDGAMIRGNVRVITSGEFRDKYYFTVSNPTKKTIFSQFYDDHLSAKKALLDSLYQYVDTSLVKAQSEAARLIKRLKN